MDAKVRVQLVVFDTPPRIVVRCVESILSQIGYLLGETLAICVLDNSSTAEIANALTEKFGSKIEIIKLASNIGFCGAHNRGVHDFLESDAEYLLVVNPDLLFTDRALSQLVHALEISQWAGSATPLLLRCDSELIPLQPAVVDAAGMYITPDLRHFDRGSDGPLTEDLLVSVRVFGGTGACLLMRRAFVLDLLLDGGEYESLSENVHPELAVERDKRKYLFDEAFFAYREDADLAWRAQLLGWECVYAPEAVVFHTRKVIPERRAELSPFINRLGVRNRFLLQLNNAGTYLGLGCLVMGMILRNLVVITAVLLTERGSRSAFKDVMLLFPRIRARRKLFQQIVLASSRQRGKRSVARWFRYAPVTEPI